MLSSFEKKCIAIVVAILLPIASYLGAVVLDNASKLDRLESKILVEIEELEEDIEFIENFMLRSKGLLLERRDRDE